MVHKSPKSRWVYLERFKWIVEILALAMGGLWALKLYNEAEPVREKRASVQGELRWTRKSADGCLGEYTVTFKNVGTTSIDLAQPVLNVWLTDAPKRTKILQYLDARELRNGVPLVDHQKLTHSEFSSHYPPDGSDAVTSVVMVQRNPGRVVLFSLDFPQSDSDTSPWSDYHWDYACDELTPAPEPKSPRGSAGGSKPPAR